MTTPIIIIGYGSLRFVVEFFRMPDDGIFGLSEVISMGQWLSLPMIIGGAALWIWFNKSNTNK